MLAVRVVRVQLAVVGVAAVRVDLMAQVLGLQQARPTLTVATAAMLITGPMVLVVLLQLVCPIPVVRAPSGRLLLVGL
jgi:hypothetical protein